MAYLMFSFLGVDRLNAASYECHGQDLQERQVVARDVVPQLDFDTDGLPHLHVVLLERALPLICWGHRRCGQAASSRCS